MVKKLALTSLLFSNVNGETSMCPSSSSSTSAASFRTAASWQWSSCTQARTISFRAGDSAEIVSMRHHITEQEEEEGYNYKATTNPAYDVLDYTAESYYSCSLSEDSSASLSTASPDEDEVIVRGIRSNRLIFKPESTSSILKDVKEAAFDGATALAIESNDPYGDFRRSMEEMVMSHGADDDWGWLEEMLRWYLRSNGKKTHGLIVGAFVDLLVALASAPSPAAPPASSQPSKANTKQSSA